RAVQRHRPGAAAVPGAADLGARRGRRARPGLALSRPAGPPAGRGSLGAVRQILVYTAARLAVFVVLLAALWLLGLTGFLLFALALGLSMPVSYLLLGRQLDAVTRTLADRRARQSELRSKLRGDR